MLNFIKNEVITARSWKNKIQSYQEVTENPLAKLEPYLKPDWDGEGAVPISPVTLRNAQAFLEELLLNVPKAMATPGLDGSLGLFWKTSEAYLYIHIYPDEDVVYYHKLGMSNPLEQEGVQEAPFDAKKLYEQLEQAFRFLGKNTSYTPKTNLVMSHFREAFQFLSENTSHIWQCHISDRITYSMP